MIKATGKNTKSREKRKGETRGLRLGWTDHPEADIAIGIGGRRELAGGVAQIPGAVDPGAALEEA
jgi:hypothetical protein